MIYVIEGPPRTKKNSPRILRRRNGQRFVAPSAAYEAWETYAVLQLNRQRARVRAATITTEVNMRAIVYRERRTGDAGNYHSAICDALQEARVVENDKLIVSFDGSRLAWDPVRPRVEVELTPATFDQASHDEPGRTLTDRDSRRNVSSVGPDPARDHQEEDTGNEGQRLRKKRGRVPRGNHGTRPRRPPE